jgi:hypothetical protein
MIVALIVFGIFAGTIAWKVGRRPRFRLGAGAATPIATAGENVPVVFLGRVRSAGKLLTAPATGRACVAYTLEIWQLEKERRRLGDAIAHGQLTATTADRRLASFVSSQEFIVEDATGRALVAPEGVEWGVVSDHVQDHEGALPPELVRLLGDRCVEPSAPPALSMILLGRTSAGLQVREGVIEEGEFVEVQGAGRWQPDQEPGAQGGGPRVAPRLLALRRETGLTYVTNDPTRFSVAMPGAPEPGDAV